MIAKKIKLNGPVISGFSAVLHEWFGLDAISPNRVLKELEHAGGQDVELYINSGGGSVFAGSEIYTALKEYKGKITSKVTGVAASAATFFMLASDEIYLSPLATTMIHNSAIGTNGDRAVHSSNLELLEGIDKSYAKLFQAKTSLNDKEILDLMQKTTWMNAEKAVQLGFADGIMFDEEIDAKNSVSPFVEIPDEVVEKLKHELLNSALKGDKGGLSGLFGSLSPDLLKGINDEPMNLAPPQQQTNEKGDKPMNLEELKAQHPALYDQVLDAGVTAERARIVSLNALATSPGAKELVTEAINNGATAGDTAIKILEANAARVEQTGKDREADAKASGVDEVPAEEAPLNEADKKDKEKEAQADQEDVDGIVAEIKRLKGVK